MECGLPQAPHSRERLTGGNRDPPWIAGGRLHMRRPCCDSLWTWSPRAEAQSDQAGPRGGWADGVAPFAHSREGGEGNNRPPREGGPATATKSPGPKRGGDSQPEIPM